MSSAHKEALAEGRRQGQAIRKYLEALEAHRPKRGRKRTSESVERRLALIDEEIQLASPLDRLHLIQERMDLQKELETLQASVDLDQLEEGFVESAAAYGDRKGITYAAWRELGVSPDLLSRAGIKRTRS
ncbi:MAG: hypothetical protein KDB86_05170 [Actinobacteria bacterium]|nr:hypothetical protein [Actinomycetota bacterium]MCB9390122.1 hypothetical protein [Acidimicrobiia bacterium]